jgi:hypothetical protein
MVLLTDLRPSVSGMALAARFQCPNDSKRPTTLDLGVWAPCLYCMLCSGPGHVGRAGSRRAVEAVKGKKHVRG